MRDLAEHRVGGVGGDPGPVDRGGVAPHGVVIPRPQHHRSIRYGRVEPARIEQPARRQTAVVGGAGDPVQLGMLLSVLLYRSDDLVHRTAGTNGRAGGFQAAVERVGVAVPE